MANRRANRRIEPGQAFRTVTHEDEILLDFANRVSILGFRRHKSQDGLFGAVEASHDLLAALRFTSRASAHAPDVPLLCPPHPSQPLLRSRKAGPPALHRCGTSDDVVVTPLAGHGGHIRSSLEGVVPVRFLSPLHGRDYDLHFPLVDGRSEERDGRAGLPTGADVGVLQPGFLGGEGPHLVSA